MSTPPVAVTTSSHILSSSRRPRPPARSEGDLGEACYVFRVVCSRVEDEFVGADVGERRDRRFYGRRGVAHRTGHRVCDVVARHVVVVVDVSLARIGLAERVVREGLSLRARGQLVAQAWLAGSKVGAIIGVGREPPI